MFAAASALLILVAAPATPPPVAGPAAFFPLTDVRAGQRAVAWSVFSGEQVEPFEITLIGVMPDLLGPGYPVILGRFTDDKGRYSGVVAGMSGSPVYVDGKLLGALGFRFGIFTKEPICGITPISLMAPLLHEDTSHSRAVAAAGPPAGSSDLRPIETPLSLAGVPAAVIEHFRADLEAAGLRPIAAGAGSGRNPSAGDTPPLGPEALVPGAAVSGELVRGDVSIAGTGTLTYREGDRVLAFGHPFFGLGPVAMPMATARVVHTLVSEAGSVKMTRVERTVGTVYADRLTAIAGVVGREPDVLPVTVRVTGGSAAGSHEPDTYRFEVFRHAFWTPLFMRIALASVMTGNLRRDADTTVGLDVRYHMRDGAPGPREVVLRDTVSDAGGFAAVLKAAVLVADGLAALHDNPYQEDPAAAVDVSVHLGGEARALVLASAWLARDTIRRGEPIRLTARLRAWHGGETTHALTMTLPAGLRPVDDGEDLEIVVGGGAAVEREIARLTGAPHPRDLAELARTLASRRADDHLHAVMLRERASTRVGDRHLPSLPPSLAAALEADGAGTMTRSIVTTAHLAVGAPLDGAVTLKLHVRPAR